MSEKYKKGEWKVVSGAFFYIVLKQTCRNSARSQMQKSRSSFLMEKFAFFLVRFIYQFFFLSLAESKI